MTSTTNGISLSNHPALEVYRRSGMGLCNESARGRLKTAEMIERSIALGEHVYMAGYPGMRLTLNQALGALKAGDKVYTHGS